MEKEEKKQEKKKGFGWKTFAAGVGVGVGIYYCVKNRAKIKTTSVKVWNSLTKKKSAPVTVTGIIEDAIPEVKPVETTSAPTSGGNNYRNGGYRSFNNSHQRVNNVNL